MVKMMVYKLLIGATFTVNLLALLLGDTDQQAGMAIFGVVAAAISRGRLRIRTIKHANGWRVRLRP